MDWQHPCYYFWPHHFHNYQDAMQWRVPVVPNGDYYIFLAEDFEFGLFGHPWENTICVFGQKLLSAFQDDMPSLFSEVVRVDGVPINDQNQA